MSKEKIRELYGTMSATELSEMFGISESTVRRYVKGISKRETVSKYEAVVEELTDIYSREGCIPKSAECLVFDSAFPKGISTSQHSYIRKMLSEKLGNVKYYDDNGEINYNKPREQLCRDRYRAMMSRCYNPNIPTYKSYGGLGVTVCEEWHDYVNFETWFHTNYIDSFELDKDLLSKVEKIYSPDTCCFLPSSVNLLIRSLDTLSSRSGNKISFTFKGVQYQFSGKDNELIYKECSEVIKFLINRELFIIRESYNTAGVEPSITERVCEALSALCVLINERH